MKSIVDRLEQIGKEASRKMANVDSVEGINFYAD